MSNIRVFSVVFIALVGTWPVTAGAQTIPLKVLASGKVTKTSGHEGLSELFGYDVEVTVADINLALDQMVGKALTMTVATGRSVTGIVESAELTGTNGTDGYYRVRIVPSMSRLRYRSSNRTFAAKKVKEIVEQVFNAAGIADRARWQLVGTYDARDITIQYRETDFAFVSRLLEDAGIHYHFDGDVAVFSDDNNGFSTLSPEALTYALNAGTSIYSFKRSQTMHPGKVQARDFAFTVPSADTTSSSSSTAFTNLVEGMFPAGAGVTSVAKAKIKSDVRLAARVAAAHKCGGNSSYTHMRAGYKFKLLGHPRAGFNVPYVVTSVDYNGSPAMFRATFSCLPASVAYRPAPITPTPLISGVVSAIVVGPSGETKHVDQYGRVRVRFPWRLAGDSGSGEVGDAGWVRVVQPAGGMLLPAVGQEVAVAFEHGDPDRPVVMGTLFNAVSMPPVALPASKNRAILHLQ